MQLDSGFRVRVYGSARPHDGHGNARFQESGLAFGGIHELDTHGLNPKPKTLNPNMKQPGNLRSGASDSQDGEREEALRLMI